MRRYGLKIFQFEHNPKEIFEPNLALDLINSILDANVFPPVCLEISLRINGVRSFPKIPFFSEFVIDLLIISSK